MLIDFNPVAKLVLLCDPGYLNPHYEPWNDGTAIVVDIPLAYLKQCHYVARAHVQGLTVNAEPMLDGWQRYAEILKWELWR